MLKIDVKKIKNYTREFKIDVAWKDLEMISMTP